VSLVPFGKMGVALGLQDKVLAQDK
jgi:hypothetical protein